MGAAAAAVAAAPRVFAQQTGPAAAGTSFYQRGNVRIRYQDVGSGFPLLCTPGGGLNSRIAGWQNAVINAMEHFKNDFRCITMDQRNATGGESTGPVPVDNPWDAFADDQLGLMDHLGIRQFVFFGNCIGGSFALKLMERAPDRVVAAVLSQPIGHRPEKPDVMYISGRAMFRWKPSRDTCTTFTAHGPTSYTACRATSYATARRRCWCCRTTPMRTPILRPSMSRRWRPMPR
jgi:pimeloyl-ACP methyl ester carboxylesterase